MLTVEYNEGMNTHHMAKALGRLGGQARARRLAPEERRRIASVGGHARRRLLDAARRIEDTLRYAATVAELRGGPPRVTRVATCRGPLPGIYPDRS
jgi:hypothetical protein